MVVKTKNSKSRAFCTLAASLMVVALVSGCSGCTSQETHDFFNDPAWEDYKKDNQGVVWGSGGVTPTPSPVEESTEEELMDHNSDLGNGA